MIKVVISFNLVISFIIMKRKKERKGISVYVVMHTENPIYASKVVNAYIIFYM